MNQLIKKREIIIFFFLWIFICYVANTSQAQEAKEKAPIITVDNPSFDMGMIEEGSPIAHTYIIKNTGTSDLKIDKVKPS